MPYSTIHLQVDTKKDLEDLKSEGQSFDGVVKELLKERKNEVTA